MKTQNAKPDYKLQLQNSEHTKLTMLLATHRRNYVKAVLDFGCAGGGSAAYLHEQRQLLEDIEKAVSLCVI